MMPSSPRLYSSVAPRSLGCWDVFFLWGVLFETLGFTSAILNISHAGIYIHGHVYMLSVIVPNISNHLQIL